jgi:hypothetical protein
MCQTGTIIKIKFFEKKLGSRADYFSQWPTGMKTSHAGWMVCEQEILFGSIPIP